MFSLRRSMATSWLPKIFVLQRSNWAGYSVVSTSKTCWTASSETFVSANRDPPVERVVASRAARNRGSRVSTDCSASTHRLDAKTDENGSTRVSRETDHQD